MTIVTIVNYGEPGIADHEVGPIYKVEPSYKKNTSFQHLSSHTTQGKKTTPFLGCFLGCFFESLEGGGL